MTKNLVSILYVVVMIVVVVGVDFLFLRHRTGPRLLANIGIVLVFGLLYVGFIRKA